MMFTLLTLAALCSGWRLTRATLATFATLRALPRSNDDLILY